MIFSKIVWNISGYIFVVQRRLYSFWKKNVFTINWINLTKIWISKKYLFVPVSNFYKMLMKYNSLSYKNPRLHCLFLTDEQQQSLGGTNKKLESSATYAPKFRTYSCCQGVTLMMLWNFAEDNTGVNFENAVTNNLRTRILSFLLMGI